MTIIHMRTVEKKPKLRALDQPLPYVDRFNCKKEVEIDFEWDGSSVPPVAKWFFPRHRHPVASCTHDKMCGEAICDLDRKFADKVFKKNVATTSWKITAVVGYIGVRIGAFFGVGSNF